MPGGLCASCPFNEFGSAENGRGKKCRNTMLLFLQQPGRALPLAVLLPPTSIPRMKKVFNELDCVRSAVLHGDHGVNA